jgi:hypothetical protein
MSFIWRAHVSRHLIDLSDRIHARVRARRIGKVRCVSVVPPRGWLPKGNGSARSYPKDLQVDPVATLGFSPVGR